MLCCKQQKPKQKRKLHKVYTPQFFATPLNRPFLACFRYLCSFDGGGQQHQQQQQPLRIFDDVIHLMNTSLSNKSNENKHRQRCCFAKRAENNRNQPQCLTIEEEVKRYGSFQPGSSFPVCPTVLLRAAVPSTGFSIVFRAMLDSGATFSRMAGSLAEVLFANGATCEYIWPVGGAESLFQRLISFDYRYISGLKLQSLEDGDEEGIREISVGDNNSYHNGCPSISVDANAGPLFIERLPITLVLKKMAQLGLPMTRSGDLGRTMWNTKTDPNSQYRFHMLIGRDLLNAHFITPPYQRSYHITPSLVLLRSAMGLSFMGNFNVNKFSKATLSAVELAKIKATLYPEKYCPSTQDASDEGKCTNGKTEEKGELTAFQKEEIKRILSFDMATLRRSWSEFIFSILILFAFCHLFFLTLLLGLIALLFRCLLIVTCHSYRFAPVLYRSYTRTLVLLLNVAMGTVFFYSFSTFRLAEQLFLFGNSSSNSSNNNNRRTLSVFRCKRRRQNQAESNRSITTLDPDSLLYMIDPVLPVKVRSPSGEKREKTALAVIDTGASGSVISRQLVEELQLLPHHIETYEDGTQEEVVELEIAAAGRGGGGGSETEETKEEEESNVAVKTGKSNGAQSAKKFTKIYCAVTSIEFGDFNKRMPSSKLERLADVLGIPPEQMITPETFPNKADVTCGELLLGTDVIPRLVLPPRSAPARVIPLAANLSATETPLGYLVQGTQLKPMANSTAVKSFPYFVHNWQYCSISGRSLSDWLHLGGFFVLYGFLYIEMAFHFVRDWIRA